MRSVVQSGDSMSSDAPSCVESPDGFTCYDTHREELLELEDTDTYPFPSTAPIYENLNSQQQHTYTSIADISSPGSQPIQLKKPS